MRVFRNILIGCVAAGSLLVLCKIVDDEEGGSRTVTSLKIAEGDASGWTEADQGYQAFKTPQELYGIINGGADIYVDRGLIEGFQQEIEIEGSDYYATFMIMDFSNADNAKSMFDYKADLVSTKESTGTYDDATAIIDMGQLTGCSGFAHFGQFYLELGFSGYGSNKSDAKNTAVSFMEIIKSKIDNM